MPSEKEIYQKLLDDFTLALKENKHLAFRTYQAMLLNHLKSHFQKMDWVGYYEYDQQRENLILTFFIGKDACEELPLTSGVCSRCFRERRAQIVPDVSKVSNHIACFSSTKSEIVLPLYLQDDLLGVLDIDSDTLGAFTSSDEEGLSALLSLLKKKR